MDSELAVEAAGLEKSFGRVPVLAGLDLRVARGSVFALLGPLSRADAGQARVAGFDVLRERHRVRRCISLTGQYAAVDGLLTGAENLHMMARLSGIPGPQARRRAAGLLAQFGLTEAGNRRVASYSGGMRRRLDLAASLVARPTVIFLDEPTTGLDLPSRQQMWQVVTGLAGAGVTVFLTTQYLEEADQLAGHVAVLDGGRVVAEGTPAQLKQQVGGQRLDMVLAGTRAYEETASLLGSRAVYQDPGSLTIGAATDGTAAHARALLDEVDPGRRTVRSFAVHAPSLDDVFLALTGHAAAARGPAPDPGQRPSTDPAKETCDV
jgi:ABC-2 type transport system ATP-binding protein